MDDRRKECVDCIVAEIDSSALRKRESECTIQAMKWINVTIGSPLT